MIHLPDIAQKLSAALRSVDHLLSHCVRAVVVVSPTAIGKVSERFDDEVLPLKMADKNHLRKREFVLRAKGDSWAGANACSIRQSRYTSPVTRRRTAGAESVYFDPTSGRRDPFGID
jgi:hypothetical protein